MTVNEKKFRLGFLHKLISNVFPLFALPDLRYLNNNGAGFVCFAQNSDVSRLKIHRLL